MTAALQEPVLWSARPRRFLDVVDAQIALGLVDLGVRDPDQIAATLDRFSDLYRAARFVEYTVP